MANNFYLLMLPTVADKKKFTFALRAMEFVNHSVGIPFPFLFVQNVAGWRYLLSGNIRRLFNLENGL